MSRQAPRFWRERSLRAVLLLPFAGVFGALAGVRRALFRSGLLPTVRLPVPVIVVGNIAVGGSGKTPVVEWLVACLREVGHTPGIVSRGYGGSVTGASLVRPDGDPRKFGDEPVLLARLTGCPVAVGRDRPAAAMTLLAAHPECDVVVSDDGLQHYRLARDFEVVVVDEATLGNRWLLPAGPLREGPGRLREADMVIVHGEMSGRLSGIVDGLWIERMTLEGELFHRLGDRSETRLASAFYGRRVHAVAGIGRPERFFEQLRRMGLDVVPHAFPDHHVFTAEDLDFAPGEPKILTAKDAVKCVAFAPPDTWEFPVKAQIDASASKRIVEKLSHGSQVA